MYVGQSEENVREGTSSLFLFHILGKNNLVLFHIRFIVC